MIKYKSYHPIKYNRVKTKIITLDSTYKLSYTP